MIISHRHQCIFIKTRKTAGTSVEVALSSMCGPQDVLTPLSQADERLRASVSGVSAQNYHLPLSSLTYSDIVHAAATCTWPRFYNHMPASQVRRRLGEDSIWSTYYTFTIERNPFDKAVSLYFFEGGPERYGSFAAFIKKGRLSKISDFELYTAGGNLLVDDVFYTEDIEAGLEKVSRTLKLNTPLALPESKAKSSTRRVDDYRDLYTDETREIVARAFAREIALHGYTF